MAIYVSDKPIASYAFARVALVGERSPEMQRRAGECRHACAIRYVSHISHIQESQCIIVVIYDHDRE